MIPKILAIIPCYNEAESIKITVESLISKAPNVDYIIVNDGSNDNTLQVCLDNNFPVINMPFNLGLATAVQTGMKYALSKSYDMALQFDGDGQHLPEYIADMISQMQVLSADIIIGSRYTQKASLNLRGLGGRLLRIAIKIATRQDLTDPTSGMRLYNHKMIKRLASQMNHGPEPDTLVYLMNKGARVGESPVTMQERTFGKSYLSALIAANYMLRMLVSILVVQRFRTKEDTSEYSA